jgi:hypothetical protein
MGAWTHELRAFGNRFAPRPWRRVRSDAWIVHDCTTSIRIRPQVAFLPWGRLGGYNAAKDRDGYPYTSIVVVIIVRLGRCWCAHQTNGKQRRDQKAYALAHD